MGLDTTVYPFKTGGIGAKPSRGPSRMRRLFVASEAGSSGSAAAGSKERPLRNQGHGGERPPAQLAVRARVAKEMESTDEGHGVTLNKLRMLREEVTGRLKALGPGEVVRARGRARGWPLRKGNGGCSRWLWSRSRRWTGKS